MAIEDQRFWTTGAIDPLSLLRAAVTDLTAGRALQGGSTITMQLVRNLYLPDTKSFTFKIKEAVIAERLEQAHSKLWILKTYLNSVPTEPSTGRRPRASRRRVDLLRPSGERRQPRRVGAARGPPPGAE